MVIEGRDLSLIYDMNHDAETYALKEVNITIRAGEFSAIVGPSGSGKSSLLYLLSGLKKPTTGTIYFDDADIESFSPFQKDSIRRNQFGFIFQKHLLIDYMTVLDNILIIPDKNNKVLNDRALYLLEQLGIKHLSGKKPFQLSVGQRQRVAVARALINQPSVVFADEPTASLDHTNAQEIMSILKNLKKGTSIVVVTHDRSILENADKIIELWDGRIKQSTKAYSLTPLML